MNEISPHYKIGDTIPDYGIVLNLQRMKQSWKYNCWDRQREKPCVFEEYDEDVILSIKLHEFMQFHYIPKGWVVTISNVDFVPHILPEDIEFLRTATDLSTYRNGIYNKWYIIEAIREFFKKEK